MKQTLIMPNLGAASDEATLVAWLVRVGDQVTVGQELYEVETDKATVPVEATEPGVVTEILIEQGSVVSIGTPIAIIEVEASEATASVAESAPLVTPAAQTAPIVESAAKRDQPAARGMSPRARRLAEQLGVDPTGLVGTGPEGRIVEADVQAAFEARQHEAPRAGRAPAGDALRGLTGHRAVVARAMATSHHDTAAVTLTVETPAGGVAGAIDELRHQHPDEAAGITVDLVLGAIVARTLRRHPQLNASLGTDGIVVHPAVNLGIAMDSARGLVVPVLRDADTRPIGDLAGEWAGLRRRVMAGTSTPQDLAGGTFTITNLGPFGIDAFTPIINRSECAILGVGRISSRAVVIDGHVTPQPTAVLSLTFDHRIVDGAPASRFLRDVATSLGQTETVLAHLTLDGAKVSR